MRSKKNSKIIAGIGAIFFIIYATRPGKFNMIGYGIYFSVFPDNSPENEKYAKVFSILLNILLGLMIYWIIEKILSRMLRKGSQDGQ